MPTREELTAAMLAAATAADEVSDDDDEQMNMASKLSLSRAGAMIKRTNTAVRDVALVVGAVWAAPWDARPTIPEKPDVWTASRFVGSLKDDDGLSVHDLIANALLDDPSAADEDKDDTADQLRYLRELGASRRQVG